MAVKSKREASRGRDEVAAEPEPARLEARADVLARTPDADAADHERILGRRRIARRPNRPPADSPARLPFVDIDVAGELDALFLERREALPGLTPGSPEPDPPRRVAVLQQETGAVPAPAGVQRLPRASRGRPRRARGPVVPTQKHVRHLREPQARVNQAQLQLNVHGPV